MRWKPFASLIALVLLTLFTSARVQSLAVWMCEGKACGISYGYCCCVSPGGCHNGCPQIGTDKSNAVSFASTSCECQAVLQSADPATPLHGKITPAVVFPPVILIEASIVPVPVFAVENTVAAHADPRGPPVAQYLASSFSLRAPPQA